jgi:type I restriction enzyme S subunit
VKAGWDVKALGEVATIINGGTPKSEVAAYWDGDVDWLTPKDMGKLDGHLVDVTPRRISREGLAKCSARQVPANSVIMSTRAPIGHLAINTVPMAFNQGCRGMVPGEKLDAKYLFYVLSANVQALDDLGTGTTFKELSAGSLKAFPVPLPPLDEQKRIVEVLDAAFEGLSRARAHTETNLQNARELFESITRQAFERDGATVTLEEVADIPSALVDPREDAFADLPHVGAGNMETGSDQLVNVMTAREEKLISGKYTFDPSMVLYSKIRPYLRKAARPDFEGLCSADVYPLRPDPSRLDRNYLFHLLMGPDFTEYAIAGSGRVGMPKVNRNHLFAYTFSLPSLAAQREATAKIDAAMEYCDQAASHYRAKLADLDAVRQALLQKAFAGELT